MASVPLEEINSGTRKRGVNERRRIAESNFKYANKDPHGVRFVQPCCHPLTSKFKCSKLTISDVLKNRKYFYQQIGKQKQDVYLCRFVLPYPPDRINRTSGTRNTSKLRKFNTSFYLLRRKKMVCVCKKFLMSVFNVGARRLHTISKTVARGDVPKENRGGDRKKTKYAAKTESVMAFIKKLPAVESHYGRDKSKRVYLSCDLNITKLRKIYNSEVNIELKVRHRFFRKIFVNNFNIGFNSPASDACGLCILLKNRLKAEQDPQKRTEIMTEKRIHSLRANAFYQLTRATDDESLSFCFDLQQIHPLPKSPIQDAYYSRQISYYTFCIVGMKSQFPHFYTWTENQAGKGSVEIGSALLSYLTKTLLIRPGIKVLRLFCDGCGGQNKNSHIIHILLYWLAKLSPQHINEIMITYPVRGHSFLPADRVFGRVEKELKVHPTITTKEEYDGFYSKFGQVHVLGDHWDLRDVKDLENSFKRVERIQNYKRILIKKIIKLDGTVEGGVQCYENYRFSSGNEPIINLLKRRKSYANVRLRSLRIGRVINSAKKKDVISLLTKIYGENWRNNDELNWYKNILDGEDYGDVGDGDEEMLESCDCGVLEHCPVHV